MAIKTVCADTAGFTRSMGVLVFLPFIRTEIVTYDIIPVIRFTMTC